jgi:hypothetical protein
MTTQDPAYTHRDDLAHIEFAPALSWGAIVAGAIGAAAVSFVLLAVGTAFGLSMVSPWETDQNAAAIGIGAAVFLIVIHVLASGFGGYMAGRLREKLTNLRQDETFFRDTAHGVLVWALGAVAGAVLIATLSAQVISGGLTLGAAGVSAAGQAAGGAMAGATSGAEQSQTATPDGGDQNISGYFTDSLFRPSTGPIQGATTTTGDAPTAAPSGEVTTPPPQAAGRNDDSTKSEAGRIMNLSLLKGEMTPEDRTYVAQLIARETGMSQADAERRVDETVAKAQAARNEAATMVRNAAEQARKGAQMAAIWSAVAMLAGGVAAGLAATWGGKARDSSSL